MTSDPIFLTFEDICAMHSAQLDEHGGLEGIRDEGGLRAACAMPEASFGGEYLHKDLFEMAAAYAFHIAEGQCFVDGNKRAGLAAALTFLDLNGIELSEPTEMLALLMLELAEHRDKSRLATELRKLAAG